MLEGTEAIKRELLEGIVKEKKEGEKRGKILKRGMAAGTSKNDHPANEYTANSLRRYAPLCNGMFLLTIGRVPNTLLLGSENTPWMTAYARNSQL